MALALYRKYRPAKFSEVVGQEHVTEPLSTALAAGRINHAYLFSGPRGCGKTSSARILARSLNCELGPTPDPCGVCPSCVSLAPGGPGNIDVTELDAASHGGVDDTRELRDRAFFAPAESRYRVFIVDEAHMITTQGFNALLKIVEEPPEHLVFVFATTEPDKVLPTIRSRTHHYPFRLIPPGTLRALLERICADEGVVVAPSVYPLVIRAGGGSARDSLSVLDQLLSGAGPEGVVYERAVSLLGVTDVALIDDMVDALAADDRAAVFETVDRLVEAGHDPRRFAADLLQRLRDVTLLQAVPEAAERGLVEAADDELARIAEQAERIGPATLTRYGEIVHTGLTEMRGATAPRLLLELLCARMLLPAATTEEAGLLQRLERLERRNDIAAGPATAADDGGGEGGAAGRTFRRASTRPPAAPAAADGGAPAAGRARPTDTPPAAAAPAPVPAAGSDRDAGAGAASDRSEARSTGTERSAERGDGPDRAAGADRGDGAQRADRGAAPSRSAERAAGVEGGADADRPAERGSGPARGAGSGRAADAARSAAPDRSAERGAGSDREAPSDRSAERDAGSGREAASDRSVERGAGSAGEAASDRSLEREAGSGREAAPNSSAERDTGSGRDAASDRPAGRDAGSGRGADSGRSVERGADPDRSAERGAGAAEGAAPERSVGRRDGASVDRAVADHDRGAAPDRTPDRAGGAAPQRAPASGRAADDGSDGPPDETPAFAPAPLAASLDAAAVRRVWPEILAAARTQSRSVEAMLVNATVRAVQDDVLVLGMGVPSLARRLSEPRNADVVSAALHSVLGVRWQVRCEHGDAPPPAPRGGGGAAAPPPPAPSRRPAPVRRSTAPDDGEPLPPEPPDEDVPPPVDEETMIAEAAATPVASGERRDPEEEAIELLSSQLGAKAMKGP